MKNKIARAQTIIPAMIMRPVRIIRSLTFARPVVVLALLAMLALLLQIADFDSQIVTASQAPDYAQLKTEAEQFYTAGSYARANETYAKIDQGRPACREGALGRLSSGRHLVARAGGNGNLRTIRNSSRRRSNSKN